MWTLLAGAGGACRARWSAGRDVTTGIDVLAGDGRAGGLSPREGQVMLFGADGLVVQEVTVNWTKASRGGAAARVRNACPVAFPLAEGALWHGLTMDEERGFAPTAVFADYLPDRVLAQLNVEADDRRLTLHPRMDPVGMPTRHRRPPRRSLDPGQWIRWQVNYRLSADHGWSYRLITWNVGLRGSWASGLFLGEPDVTVAELADLW